MTYTINKIESSTICGTATLPLDKKRILRIQQSGYDVKYDEDWCYPSLSKNLMRMLTKVKDNTLHIDYHRDHKSNKKMSNITRAKADACISAGDTSRNVRAGLWGDTCYDLDMNCAHHALILSVVEKDDEVDVSISFPTLKQYVHNKKDFRKSVADQMFNGDVQQAKDAICAITFGSSLKNAFKDSKTTSYPKECVLLREELIKFADLVEKHNSEYAKVVQKEVEKKNKQAINAFIKKTNKTEEDAKSAGIGIKNWKHTLMSEWCCNKETICMERVIRFCIEEGVIKDRRFDNSKDGVMIPKADVDAYLNNEDTDINTMDELLSAFHDEVDELGFTIFFDEKDMTDDHTQFWKDIEACENDLPFDKEHCERFDKDFMNLLDTYGEKKKYWELFFAQIVEISRFVFLMTIREKDKWGDVKLTKKLIYYSKKDLVDTFDHLPSGNVKIVQGEAVAIPFLTMWLKDKNYRTHNKIDNLPYAGVHDPKRCTPDIMNAFVGYPEHIWSGVVEYSDEVMFKMLQPFFDVQAHLVGEQGFDKTTGRFPKFTCMQDVLNHKHLALWLAIVGHRIARPDEPRKPFTPVIHGVQGTGKNVSTNVLGSLVGDDHYICTSNPEDFFSTHAEGFVGKLITVMNELDLTGSAKSKNKMKGIISEDKAVCNRKFVAPFQYTVIALSIILSNEKCPIVLEMNANRRYLIFNCNDRLARDFTQNIWKKLIAKFQSTEFLRCLRQFFERFDYDAYDYTEGLKHNHQARAYKQMLSHFFPADLRFFQHFIEQQKFANTYAFNDSGGERAFYTNPQWDKEVHIKSADMQTEMVQYLTEENQTKSLEKYKQKQKFNNHIQDLNLPMTKTTKNKAVVYTMTPKTVYHALIEKGLVDLELCDSATLEALGEVVVEKKDESDIGVDDWF